MKKIFLLLALASSLTAFGQHQRRVLVEEFTNASCPPCAAYNPAFNAKLVANDQYVTPIKYQVWWPGFDPMYNQTEVDVDPRVAYYSITGVPAARVSGTSISAVTAFSDAVVQTSWNNLTPVTMTITHHLSAAFDSIYIDVSVTSDAPLTGNLRLRVGVVENDIYFDGAPGTNGETEFFDVMRKMLPDAAGTATGDFAAAETKNYSFAWPLDYIYNLNAIEAVAWLQNDGTKEVYQSERSQTPNDVPDAGAELIISSASLSQLICSGSFTPSFSLRNTGTTEITEANIQYRLNGGAWATYTWTGTLAPNAQIPVSLGAQALTGSGGQTFDVMVASTNNGIQTNMVTGMSTYNLIVMGASVPYPLVDGFETATFPPANWALIDPIGSGWISATVGAFGQSTRSTKVDFYNIAEGNELVLYAPNVDLTNAASAELQFDHAYTYYQSGATVYKDRVVVEVSTDCGATWTSVFDKEGDALKTANAQAAAFTPTAAQWATNTVDLNDYVGLDAIVRFRAISGYGNNFYLDNVNLSAVTVGTTSPLALGRFAIQPNPTATTANLAFTLINAEKLQLNVYNAAGALVQSQVLGNLPAGDHTVSLDAAKLANGSYRVVLVGEQGLAQQQWMIAK